MNGKTATDTIALQEELLTGLVSASYVSKQAEVREVDLVIGVPPELKARASTGVSEQCECMQPPTCRLLRP